MISGEFSAVRLATKSLLYDVGEIVAAIVTYLYAGYLCMHQWIMSALQSDTYHMSGQPFGVRSDNRPLIHQYRTQLDKSSSHLMMANDSYDHSSTVPVP